MRDDVSDGLSFVPVTIAGLSGVHRSDAGIASGLINTSRQVGGAVGLAAVTTIAASYASNGGGATGQDGNHRGGDQRHGRLMANPPLSDKCANAVQQCAPPPLRRERGRTAKRISFAGISDLRLLSTVKLARKSGAV